MRPKHLYLFMLRCVLTLPSGCKDDDDNPLRFYNGEYGAPMGGRRYLGLESGNGDYSLAMKDTRVASAGTEADWSGIPAEYIIYVTGTLTGMTCLAVADNVTQETCTLPIKVVDNCEDMELLHSYLSSLSNGDADLLPGISDIFLTNSHARDTYLFKQGERTTFLSEPELVTQGSYKLEKEEGNDKKMTLTLIFSKDTATLVSDHRFMIWGNSYLFHQLDKSLNLNWNTPPTGEMRTSPAPPSSYTLEEITGSTEIGKDRQLSSSLSQQEMPAGILP